MPFLIHRVLLTEMAYSFYSDLDSNQLTEWPKLVNGQLQQLQVL